MARTRTVATAAVVAVVLVACGGGPDVAETEPPAIDDEPEEDAIDEPPADEQDDEPDAGEPEERDRDRGQDEGRVAAGLDAQIEAAVADLSQRAGVAADAITVVTAEQVTWRDGSIGCPDPDQMYTMALVEGYRIVLEADGDRFDYHGQDGSEPFYCADPDDPGNGHGRVTE